MKKILLMYFIVSGMMLTGCVSTKEYSYTSPMDYMEELNRLNGYYNGKGYYLNGEVYNLENDLHINGYQYFVDSYWNGTVLPVLENDYLYKNTYSFMDSVGNTVRLTLGYKVGRFESSERVKDEDGCKVNVSYDEIVFSEVCGCEASDRNGYVELCKNEQIQRFNNNLDKKSVVPVSYVDRKKTDIALCIGFSVFVITLFGFLSK